jgi:PAS domain S-box-containing protein
LLALQPARSRPLISTGVAARWCGISRHTLLRAARRGELPPAGRMPGGGLRFYVDDIEAYADQLRLGSQQAGPRSRRRVAEPRASDARSRPLAAYDQLFQISQDLLCLIDTLGDVIAVNPAFTRLLGWSPDKLLARPFLQLVDAEDYARVDAAFATLARREHVDAFETRCAHHDGSWRRIAWNINIALDETLVFALGRDETVVRSLEDALRASEARVRALAENGGDLARVADANGIPRNRPSDPAVRGMVVTSRDSTEQMEEALRSSERRFRLAFDEAPAGMALTAPDGRLLEVNRALCRMLGYSEQELLEQGNVVLTHPDDVAESRERIRQLLAGDIHSSTLEKRYLHKQGQVIWTHYTASLLRAVDGRPLYFIFHIQDITARKLAEAMLRESEDRFRTLIEQAPVGACIVDEHGIVEMANDAYCALYGYTREELLGQHVTVTIPMDRYTELLEMEDASALAQPGIAHGNVSDTTPAELRTTLARMSGLLEIYETHHEGPREGVIYTKGGEVRHILAGAAPIVGSDGHTKRAAFIVDTSERVRAARALTEMQEAALKAERENAAVLARINRELARSNAELEQFASVASHDLRSPLNTIGSFAQLLSMRYAGKLDQDADEFLTFIVDAVKRMQQLIDDLLAFARVGAQESPPEPVDCAALARHLTNLLSTTIVESGAVISYSDLPTVPGQASQLSQVFQNLIANAIKFHGEAPLQVTISALRQGNEWLFSVQDNGIGIDPAYVERVFVLFQRLHTREEYPGTGIGLAVCKKIIERHGGRIWLESRPGHGTRVLFTLPA